MKKLEYFNNFLNFILAKALLGSGEFFLKERVFKDKTSLSRNIVEVETTSRLLS